MVLKNIRITFNDTDFVPKTENYIFIKKICTRKLAKTVGKTYRTTANF